MKNISAKVLVVSFSTLAFVACSSSTSEKTSASGVLSGSTSGSAAQQLDTQKQALVSFKLTDAPNKALKSVVVDVDHLEVLVEGAGKTGRLQLSKGLGPVDLLKLQNGVTLPLQDVVAPHGLKIQQIRLILKSEGHYAVKGDDSVCELKTPSAQKTGVKIILTNKIQFEAGNKYDIVVDFDALKSVVVQGNGGCLLKPVLKLKSATKAPIIVPPAPPAEDSSETNPTDNSNTDTTTPPADDVVTGPGEVIDVSTDANDVTIDDGWDYVPVIDGQDPVLSPDQLDLLM